MGFDHMKVLVTQSYLTLGHPVDCSQPSSSVHGILQATYWSGFPFPSGIFPTQGSNLGLQPCRQIFYRLNHQGSPLITWPSLNLSWWPGMQCADWLDLQEELQLEREEGGSPEGMWDALPWTAVSGNANKTNACGDLLGGPVAKMSCSQFRGPGFSPWSGN